jgi:hypothetical protein
MTLPLTNINTIFDMFTQQPTVDLNISVESIDDHFTTFMQYVEKKFLQEEYDPIFELFIDLIKKEVELKQNNTESFLVNNQDFNKLLIYEINFLHNRIIQLFSDVLSAIHFDHLFINFSEQNFDHNNKNYLRIVKDNFLKLLKEHRYLNETIMDQYREIII